MSARIRSHRDLDVYKRAFKASMEIFELSKRFPKEETYSLTDQIRRSSRAVSAMTAEAWAHRRYPAAFRSKLVGAAGEAAETQAWLDHALACDYLTLDTHTDFNDAWQQIWAMVNGMIDKTDRFCS